MNLNFALTFDELYQRDGLIKLDAAFVNALKISDLELYNRFMAARANPSALSDKDESELLIALATPAEDFIAQLFGIEKEVRALADQHHQLTPLYTCKRLFVQRRAAKQFKPEDVANWKGAELEKEIEQHIGVAWDELAFATAVMKWMEAEAEHAVQMDVALRYAAWALYAHEGQHKHASGLLFKQPKKLDFNHLVPVETEIRDGITVMKLPHHHLRQREGFALTDPGASLAKALDETNYCIFCHNQGRDSCSKGLKEKDGSYKKSVFDVTLAGCPLEEKISEMNTLKSAGVPLGALAMVVIDNPMCAGTGHRICNDCMKSCIYQKQEPVNIPQAETRTLKDVLELPYGFEIYSLLTRWNPLNLERPIPRADTGYKVLVSGLGPAGYTLAHHLMNDGHTVVAIDGLKIEPLPDAILREPIKDINVLRENLDERVLAGFGGVAEYGITVRWDKNYLKIIRLLLERRAQFAMFGGVRFGSALTIENAWGLGFDHIALCMGAGKPTIIDMPNGLARGVRAASDFLMALQLTGAAKKDSIANLQLRLPVVVIGGGLTAIDTATESLAYYPVQVEKFLARYEALIREKGEAAVRLGWNDEEAIIADEFIAHAKAIREERQKAAPDIHALLDSWGGVKLVYRKRLIDAPSYRLNHEEVELALQEGIYFAESWEPVGVEIDGFGHAQEIKLRNAAGEEKILPARAILIAAGTSPNTVLQREDPTWVELHGKYFRALDEAGQPVSPERVAKPNTPQVLMALESDGRAISFFGDLHPSFAGNVVKAMGSAKQGYPVVSRVLEKRLRTPSPLMGEGWDGDDVSSSSGGKITPTAGAAPLTLPHQGGGDFLQRMREELGASVHAVNRLTPTIIEVVVKAPLAARQFLPGQFYRLQNYEAFALKSQNTTLAMEGLALTGAWTDKEQGLLSTIVLEMGGSSDLCTHLAPGEPVVLMGPTGTPTHIPSNETVMLVGGGLGNAVLFSIGRAMREQGCKVLYFAGYKKSVDRYKVEEIEAAADTVVWCCDESLVFTPNRPQDRSFHGNIIQAILSYQEGKLGEVSIPLTDVNHIIAIGSDRMMAAVAAARHTMLKPYLRSDHIAIGSINSPMQCMMKEICAQCLQKHVDPVTGKEEYVFSCFNQDQLLDNVSFPHLNERLKQNAVQEKLTVQWIDRCLKSLKLRSEAA